MSNIAVVKVNEIVSTLLPLYVDAIKNGNDFTDVPAVMLWGPPGVGKSESQKTLATRLKEAAGSRIKTVNTKDVRLLLFNPVDLRGIPVPDADRQFAKWLQPEIFNMDASEDVVNLLLLDEISAAPPSVQAAAYQLVLDRKIGEHTLPKNTIIMAAGNRLVDKGVAYKIPTPLANRFTHFEIKPDIDDWKDWAIPAGMDERLIGYLSYRPDNLFKFNSTNDDVAFATPRSWAFVNRYLKSYGSAESARVMVTGAVGQAIANDFIVYCRVAEQILSWEDILDGKEVKLPTKQQADVWYAIAASLTVNAPKGTKPQLSNLLRFLDKMPEEFAVLTMRDMLRDKGNGSKFNTTLCTLPEFGEWTRKHRNFLI